MIKSIKNKFIFLVTLSLSLMLMVTGYFAFKPKEKINAYSPNISVTYGNFDKNNLQNFGKDEEDNDTSKVVNDDTFVLLPNDNSKAIKVHFELSNSEDKIISLSTSLTINGVSMDTQQNMEVDKDTTDFTQYIYYGLSLKENPTDTSSDIRYTGVELQGEYIYTFEYVSSLTNTKQIETAKFYLGFESDYLNNTDSSNTTEPILYNTEKIFRYKDSNDSTTRGDKSSTSDNFVDTTNKEFNYFHYSNEDIYGYDCNIVRNNITNNLLFPTYTYDASRYNLSWTCALNGITTYYTTEFVSNDNGGYINIYKSLNSNDKGTLTNEFGLIQTTATPINSNNINNINQYKTNHYYVNIQFDQVGEYQFSLQPVISLANHTYKVIDTLITTTSDDYNAIADNYYLFGNVELRIFGYELFYTNYNGGSEDVLQFITRDSQNNLITADVTNKVSLLDNSSTNTKDLTFNNITLDSSLTFENAKDLFNEKIVTNQAPIMFSKYAAQMLMKDSIQSQSTCLYFPTNTSNATHSYITNSTKFSSNGYYIVTVKYTYMYYSQYENGSKQPKTNEEFYQVFAFQIKNTEPSVTITSNSETIYSNEITNNNIAFIYETNNSLFDVLPSTKVFALFNTNTGSYRDVTSNQNYVTNESNEITLKAFDNQFIKYKIELQYGPNKNTSVVYSFTIDKTAINTSVYTVDKVTDTNSKDYNKYLIGEIVSEQNNFAVTNQNFYLNINNNEGTKTSGTIISATYDYYTLQKEDISNNKYDSENTENYKYIENGYFIDLNTKSTYNYGVASFENNSNIFTGNNASYVLTNPGLYIFTIKDSAGNSYKKTVLYENTSPLILIDNDLNDNNVEYSILSIDRPIYLQSVNVAYGVNKAIKVNYNNSVNINDLIPSSSYFDSDKNYFYFKNYPNISLDATGNYSVLRNNTNIPYGYTLKLEKSTDGCTYTLTITSNEIKSSTKEITMSTDNSQFMAHPLDSSNDSLLTENRIDEFDYTNKNILKFSWINDLGGDYEIESINLQYYPLTYDKTSNYYPYSKNPTSTTDLLSSATVTNKDVIDECYASIDFNATGMYVVERTYHNEISDIQNSLDQKTRKYIYFIDRNDIFKVIELNENSSITLGDLISMTIGNDVENDDNYKISLTADNFILKGNNSSLFSSNKLPIKLLLNDITFNSYYKYAQNDITGDAQKGDSIFENIYINNIPSSWLSAIKSAYKLNILVDGNQISLDDDNLSITSTGTHTIEFKNKNDSWLLRFTIDSQAPTGYFVKSTSNNSYALLDESPINYTEDLKFVWNEPTNEYEAKIDKSKTKISVNGQYIDFNADMISSDTLYNNIINLDSLLANYTEGDLLVEIYLEYYNNNNYENYTNIKKIYIDRTAPDINYSYVKQYDTYLSNEQKSNFEDYNNDLSYDNYAFNIDKNFTLKLDNSNDEFITNTNTLYIRHYDKYNDDLSSSNYVNYQSLINSDERYYDNNIMRLKFNPAYSGKTQSSDSSYMWINPSGTEKSVVLYELLQNPECNYKYGYFEIIEVDEAGNQRIFTVYLPNYEQDENNNLIEEQIVFKDENGDEISEPINSTSLGNFTIETKNNFDDLNKRLLVLEIIKDNNVDSIFKISPITLDGYISLSEAREIILNKAKEFDEISGTHYEFNIYYDTISLNSVKHINTSLVFNYPSEKLSLTFTPTTSGNTRNLIVSWNNNASTYITKLIVETANTDGSFTKIESDKDGNLIKNLTDNNGNYIAKTFTFNIQAGEYFKFTLTDNFNRTYSLDYIAGLSDVKEISYARNSIELNDITYTASQTTVSYQSKLYKVEIYDLLSDNSSFMLTEDELQALGISHSTNSSTGIATYSLFNLNQAYKLLVKVTNLDSTYTYIAKTIQYVNKLATVQLKFGSDVVFDLDTSISSDINSTLNSLSLFIKNEDLPDEIKTKVYASFTLDGQTTDLGEVTTGTAFTQYGKYTLTATNNLGLFKTFVFEFRDSKASDFTISTILGKILTSSSKKYTYANSTCEWFFTTTDYEIEYSGRFASMTQDFVTDNGNTIVYKLTGLNDTGDPTKTRVRYFAVTKVNSTSNFINEIGFTINSNKITSSLNSLRYFDNELVLKLETPYYQYEGNIITVNYSYNGSKLMTIPFDSITQYNLQDAGIYTFYFSDEAGNTQVFSSTRYLTVSLFNKVITLVNNNGQINNAVYNNNVQVTIVNYSDYIYENRNTITVDITKDGNPYNISGRSGVYTFSEYGVYNISISGIMQGRTLSNELKFTILNPYEALVAYEYIGNSGYEITAISRDGQDVYDEILRAMSKQVYEDDLLLTSLSKIVLSGSSLPNHIGGNGRYTITVTARKVLSNLDLDFTFDVWINSANDVYILSSIDAGTSTTKEIEIRINPRQIFEKIGTCNITINDRTWLTITKDGDVYSYLGPTNGIELVQSSSSTVAYSIYKLTQTGNYNFKIQTVSGNNTLMSFTVTKNEPLNGTAILVIVIVVIVIAGIITLFVLMRKKMRVK